MIEDKEKFQYEKDIFAQISQAREERGLDHIYAFSRVFMVKQKLDVIEAQLKEIERAAEKKKN